MINRGTHAQRSLSQSILLHQSMKAIFLNLFYHMLVSLFQFTYAIMLLLFCCLTSTVFTILFSKTVNLCAANYTNSVPNKISKNRAGPSLFEECQRVGLLRMYLNTDNLLWLILWFLKYPRNSDP